MESPAPTKGQAGEGSGAKPLGKSRKKRKAPSSSEADGPLDPTPAPHAHARKQRHCEVEQRRRNRLKGHYEQLDWLCVQIDPTLANIRRDRDATLMSAIRIIRTLLDTRSAAPSAFGAFNSLYSTGLPIAHTRSASPSESSVGPMDSKQDPAPSSLVAPSQSVPAKPIPSPPPAPPKRAVKSEPESKSSARSGASKKKAKTKASPAPAPKRKPAKSAKSEKSTNSARSAADSLTAPSESRRSSVASGHKDPATSDNSTIVSLVTETIPGPALPASSPSASASPQSAVTNESTAHSTSASSNSLRNVPRSVSSGDAVPDALPPFAGGPKTDLASRMPGPSASMADLFFAMSNAPRGTFPQNFPYSMPEMANSAQSQQPPPGGADAFRAVSPPFLSQVMASQQLASKEGPGASPANANTNALLNMNMQRHSPSPFHMLSNPGAYFNPMAASSIGFSSNITSFPLGGPPHMGQFNSPMHPYGQLLASAAQGSQLAGPSLSSLSAADLRALAALTQPQPTPQQLAAMAVAAAQAAAKGQ